ncbi:hypothetical protein LTR36_007641 [Oleoguttula mirabilis]|uniref:Polynucleotide 5'-hydroxyl-kinase GRC3 n=1 Tax=Oleoguttula mirabilis TaxID=1507867 RepID=A0AAV9JU16_9PEZI|nr:hypothetical protein LTR36_007641 [Oleoguttula mirabilis]
MAQKRKVQEAFGKQTGQLSAFAAARLAKQTKQVPAQDDQAGPATEPVQLATAIAEEPYVQQDLSPQASESALDVDQIVAEAKATIRGSDPTLSTLDRRAGSLSEDADGALTVTYHSGESVTCIGEYDLQVLRGIATVYGIAVHPNSGPQRVYAPSTHALPRVAALRDGTTIRLSHVGSSLRRLEKLSPLFRNVWAKPTEQDRSFTVLRTAAEDELQRVLFPLEVERSCQNALAKIALEGDSSKVRVMAIGAKSSGKSTFNRLLCNTFLSRPAVQKLMYLDLDPGQPEFGSPGQLSLVEVTAPILGPPFTHPAGRHSSRYRLVRSHTIAATSFKDDPAHYVACVADLVRHVEARHPLVVNACGWVTGVGANVLADLTSLAGITDLVVLEPVEDALVDYLRSAWSDLTCHRLPRQLPRPSPRTPAEARAMQTMAYFHHKATKASGDGTKWCGKPISATRPWIVSYDGTAAGIHSILSYGQSPSPEFLAEVLDGSLVALVTVDEHHADEAFGVESYTVWSADSSQAEEPSASRVLSAEDLINRTQEGLPYIRPDGQGLNHPLHPKYSECLGLALVRAIDTERKELHLVTPLSESEIAGLMRKRVVLVRGSFDAPEWAYLEDLHAGGVEQAAGLDVDRPWVSKKERVGIEGAVWRLRHPPMAGAVGAGRQA